jgi:hypothetical protein
MAAARIPFSESDHQVIRSLCGWALFLAIVYLLIGLLATGLGCFSTLGAVPVFPVSAFGAVLVGLRALCIALAGVILCAQAVFAIQTRSSLLAVVDTDTEDQQHLTRAFSGLKLFFLCQLAGFGVGLIMGFIGVALALVAPELVQAGPRGFGGLHQ